MLPPDLRGWDRTPARLPRAQRRTPRWHAAPPVPRSVWLGALITSAFVVLGGYVAAEAVSPPRTPSGAVEAFLGSARDGDWTATWGLQCHEVKRQLPHDDYVAEMRDRHPDGSPPFAVLSVDLRFTGRAYVVETALTDGRDVARVDCAVVREGEDYRVCGIGRDLTG